MNVEIIRRMIGQCDVPAELAEVRRAADDRSKLLAERTRKRLEGEAWERVRHLPHGTKLYCCASGFFLGGNIQRGTAMTVYSVQPRAKRLWVLLEGETSPRYWFAANGVHRYDLRTEPPANPCSRDMAERMAKVGEIINTEVGA